LVAQSIYLPHSNLHAPAICRLCVEPVDLPFAIESDIFEDLEGLEDSHGSCCEGFNALGRVDLTATDELGRQSDAQIRKLAGVEV